ncbi:hypothetical protein GLAREA_04916 [Glarea lozoyensis ATCC 20868]|uniref:Uncharacterized protein n=1 Tax=Glarea lozoyensis (strain ATCC 20868 / MF5171) TaxID=1116229 RepID=S3CR23_GLAL2|nr:uncharacterized protein GLAREA_04916 [Glarea lozoyensis ATCC 20868]EPE28125.1 hypothetical protein GLAREA_04916 [Glarea lozoyensis ATCC 20868]
MFDLQNQLAGTNLGEDLFLGADQNNDILTPREDFGYGFGEDINGNAVPIRGPPLQKISTSDRIIPGSLADHYDRQPNCPMMQPPHSQSDSPKEHFPNEIGITEDESGQRKVLPSIENPGKPPNAEPFDLVAIGKTAQQYFSPLVNAQPEISKPKQTAGTVRRIPENGGSQFAKYLVPPLSPVKTPKDFKGNEKAYWLYHDTRKKLLARRRRKIRAIEKTEDLKRKRQREEDEMMSGFRWLGGDSHMESSGLPGPNSDNTTSDEKTENGGNHERKIEPPSPLGPVRSKDSFDDEQAFKEYQRERNIKRIRIWKSKNAEYNKMYSNSYYRHRRQRRKGEDCVTSLPDIDSYRKNGQDGYTTGVSVEGVTDEHSDSSMNLAGLQDQRIGDERVLYNVYPPLPSSGGANYSEMTTTSTDVQSHGTKE